LIFQPAVVALANGAATAAGERSSLEPVFVITSAAIALNRKKYPRLWRRAGVDPKIFFHDRSNATTLSRSFLLYEKDEL